MSEKSSSENCPKTCKCSECNNHSKKSCDDECKTVDIKVYDTTKAKNLAWFFGTSEVGRKKSGNRINPYANRDLNPNEVDIFNVNIYPCGIERVLIDCTICTESGIYVNKPPVEPSIELRSIQELYNVYKLYIDDKIVTQGGFTTTNPLTTCALQWGIDSIDPCKYKINVRITAELKLSNGSITNIRSEPFISDIDPDFGLFNDAKGATLRITNFYK
jgi:hypothetical protein